MRLCPLPGNAKRASHVVEEGASRLSASYSLSRQAVQGKAARPLLDTEQDKQTSVYIVG